ncbi:MAG TPA: hypothetical protein VIT42_17980 [Microlunatus sp.]
MPVSRATEAGAGTELWLRLIAEPGADPDEIERSNRQLLSELKELDIEDLRSGAIANAPAGSKGAEIVTTGEWLLTLSASGGVLATVVGILRDWLGRRRSANKLSVTIDGDTITLDRASDAEREALIETFVSRHSHRQGE